jgi:hypothetical protein
MTPGAYTVSDLVEALQALPNQQAVVLLSTDKKHKEFFEIRRLDDHGEVVVLFGLRP